MQRWIATTAALCAVCCSPVSAAVVYHWQASCVERIVYAGAGATDLGCTGDVHGQFVMPEGYVPGSEYPSASGGGARFVIFDEVFLAYTGQPFASYGLGTSTFSLPMDVGAPSGILTNSAFIARFDASGLRFSTELALATPISGFALTASNVTARLVPVPSTWLLVLLPTAFVLLGAGRQQARARSLETVAAR